MTRPPMAHRPEPEPPRRIDWAVAIPVGIAILLLVWAFLTGALTIGGPA